MTIGDSLWWSFVTASTVVLILIGIGFVGMLTGTIATYFLQFKKVAKIDSKSKAIIDISYLWIGLL
ncbi:MAG TPA: hypothetical protein GX707_05030 [Epulopiscium sp.]|nr:hypothetical protein [Candidatus Epulonipiscium sp.]